MGKKETEIDTKPRKSILWMALGSVILACGMVGVIVYAFILIESIVKIANGNMSIISGLAMFAIYYVFLLISVIGLAILGHGISLRH